MLLTVFSWLHSNSNLTCMPQKEKMPAQGRFLEAGKPQGQLSTPPDFSTPPAKS